MINNKYLISLIVVVAIILLTKNLMTPVTINEEIDKLKETVAEKEIIIQRQEVMETEVAGEDLDINQNQEVESKLPEKLQADEHNNGKEVTLIEKNEKNKAIHPVLAGESLFLISRQYGITVEELMQENNLTANEILVGQVLYLPEGVTPLAQPRQMASRGTNTTKSYSENDAYWLAKIIHAEARGEVYEGQVAVGAVILNRVKSTSFANTIYGVIFEKWDGKYYQFSPVLDGTINLEPNQTAYRAARDAITGGDPSGGALYFYNPITSTNRWIYDRPIIKKIGKHVFAL